jgi:hypothetical protein
MALLEDVFGNGVGGPAAVVGAVVLGSLLLPAVAGAARPAVAEARAELESGAVAEERARQKGGGRGGPRDSKAGDA